MSASPPSVSPPWPGGPAPVGFPFAGATAVVGILNLTPDSFSDGGRHATLASAVAQAQAMVAAGAAMVDVGAESTRPGHVPVPADQEAARLLPVLEALRGTLGTPVSVDTTKAAVARLALAAGAGVVNDQWGLQGDPAMAGVAAEAGAGVVVMHNRQAIDPDLAIADDLRRFFEVSLAIADRAGIAPTRIVLDPGIGFGKTPAQQVAALAAIPALRAAFGLPVLVGVSRKSFLGRLTGAPVERRLPETLAANVLAHARGARLFRVHDVAEHVAALTVAAALGEESGPCR